MLAEEMVDFQQTVVKHMGKKESNTSGSGSFRGNIHDPLLFWGWWNCRSTFLKLVSVCTAGCPLLLKTVSNKIHPSG
jgi:hypothetical protein